MARRTRARVRSALRWLLALFYLVAGTFHLLRPDPFLAVTPDWVPAPESVILLTGLAELGAAPALLQPWSKRLRGAAGIGLALYAVCVYPANVNHMLIDLARSDLGLGLVYHVPRLLAQPLLVWLALWCGEVIDWPFAEKRVDRGTR
ncbi:MAG: DoxX family protein [Novosphingobium sp.]|nr:DoxX family protein [Novosphingobium sp.]